MKSYSVTIQMKATEQYFPVMIMFIMLYKVVLFFFETVKNSCSVPIQIKTSLPILSDGTVNYAVQSGWYF